MKLVIAVVQSDRAGPLAEELAAAGFSATKLASTGGFLRAGSSTFLIGVEDHEVDGLLALIRRVSGSAASRRKGGGQAGSPAAGTMVLVVAMDRLIKA